MHGTPRQDEVRPATLSPTFRTDATDHAIKCLCHTLGSTTV